MIAAMPLTRLRHIRKLSVNSTMHHQGIKAGIKNTY
jgi:hypothetical protein